MNYWLFILPFVAALTGWIINSIVITLLFHPHETRKIMGIHFRGLLPAKLPQLADRLARSAGNELIPFDAIEKKISDPASLEKIMPLIEEHVDEFLQKKLTKEIPFLSMFIGDKTVASVKKVFMQEIQVLLPQVITQFAGNLKEEFDVRKIINQKIGNIPPAQLEKWVKENMVTELRFLRLLGAVTGFIIGAVAALTIVLIS